MIKSSCSSLFILLIFLHPSHAANHTNCSPSSCGAIPSISPPFRLKHHHKHCGYPHYELACENDVAFLYLNSQKYQVKAIDYQNHTIRLADASININTTCSFPHRSLYHYNFRDEFPYSTRNDYSSGEVAWPVNFMSCPYPLKDPSLFTEATHCVDGEHVLAAPNSSNSRYTYVKVGHMNASYVQHMCRVDLIAMTSWKLEDVDNVSLSEIHDSLVYGFELSWWRFPCGKCKQTSNCLLSKDHKANCLDMPAITILFFLFILVLFAGAFPVLIIIGFACSCGIFSFYGQWDWSFRLSLPFVDLLRYTVLIHTARILIGFPLVMVFLLRKYRRRHMSMFDAIESFLRSDNKLMPIRYSYSDIKRMTGGFRDKLGQGGYGSVYKGKLRGGDYVAVKLLEKPKANDQDFMNEIATIGRIHHVNIVKLVGYCAERSKRALLYDFMPNGSLEKYICSPENMNWKTKFEIAVGVARGIEYLHRGCDIQILHFDIKPHNILLDDKFVPKISDFGLAKYCSTEKKTVTLTAARGTIGYVAPELINRGIGGVSYKADVYSFGMLLIAMVGLKRDLIGNDENSSQYFPYWIYHCLEQDRDIEFGITTDGKDDIDNDSQRKIARKMTIVALWCIQMRPDDRPPMNKVLEMLEGEVGRLRTPDRLSQPPQVAEEEDQRWSTYSTDSVSLLCQNAAPSVDIIVEDLPNMQQL